MVAYCVIDATGHCIRCKKPAGMGIRCDGFGVLCRCCEVEQGFYYDSIHNFDCPLCYECAHLHEKEW